MLREYDEKSLHGNLEQKPCKDNCYKAIKRCRVCNSGNLTEVFALGEQCLTGVFPKAGHKDPTSGPVDLMLCNDCGLVQLRQSYELSEMYGNNYGYRSGLNHSMVNHLQRKIRRLEQLANIQHNDLVIDIGSNDATSLKSYTVQCHRVGIDPTSKKFREYYTDGIERIEDFFSAETFNKLYSGKKAKIITSIAMFYDLESPIAFAKDVNQVLSDEGIWHFEQSYLPSMLQATAYDTICHEHLEFYSLEVIQYILQHAGFDIVEVELNDINGGSVAVTACKKGAQYKANAKAINSILQKERELSLKSLVPYKDFVQRIHMHSKALVELLQQIKAEGKKAFGYGASTKGNVLLQYCGIDSKLLPFIVEVNPEKFGAVTPGTHIPIISEEEGRRLQPDYYLVLPWHFRENIVAKESDFLHKGGKMIFPLPHVEIVSS